ncbi:hypothetical protein GCK32_003353 [Trichostrongylus colubriformis]|uniref:Serine/threonine-protein phosphatase 4 regulatory subunit 3-like central domain-containing protein n=1 Tax=Trichostrongylus colubriformis TaxID=6319 RepID=A0AAN8F425_TRICO
MMLTAANPYSSSSNNNHFQIQDVTDVLRRRRLTSYPQSEKLTYSSYANENEAPEEGALVDYCRLDKRDQPSIPRIFDASTVVSAKLRTPPLISTLLSDKYLKDLIGMLEYDPAHEAPRKHREFLYEKATFREVLANDELKLNVDENGEFMILLDYEMMLMMRL